MASHQRWQRHAGQEGQALLVVLIAVTLLSLIGAAMTALWGRSVILTQRKADETKALYAAEAGLTEGLARIFSGDPAFLGGYGELTGQAGGGAYHVQVSPAGAGSDAALAIVSTGWPAGRPDAARRTVRLVVDSPFFRPVVAGRDLKLLRRICVFDVCFEWPFSATFNPGALYGGALTAGDDTVGVRPGIVRFPVLSYAAVAGRIPVSGDPVTVSSKQCYLGTSGWFMLSNQCSSVTVAAPWVGIIGDVDLDHLSVNSGSVLVTAGDLVVTDFAPIQAQAIGGGGGVVVAGGKIEIETIDFARWGESAPISLLALDTNTVDCAGAIPGCTYDPKSSDRATDLSNSISISEFSLASIKTSTQLVAYAAPFRVPPGGSSRPSISVNVGSLVKWGETTFRGALVSAGDVTVADYSGLSLTSWKFEAKPQLLGPLFRLAASNPGTGILTQISWSEESRITP